MTFFLRIPKCEFQNWDFCYLETLDAHIFFKSTCLEQASALSYNPQKDLSYGVLHAPIRDHLTPALRGFMVGSQIPNLTFTFSFDMHLNLKTFPMVSWGFDLTHVCLFNQGFKHWGLAQVQLPKWQCTWESLAGLLKFGNRTNVRFRCFFGHLLPLKACDSCTSILTMG
jgi:hypothetical protein